MSVDNEEAALLHEEATMTIEELLCRFGQNKNAKKPCPGASKESEEGEKSLAEKGINGETESEASEADSNGKKAAGAGDAAGGSKMRACRRAAVSAASDGSAKKSGSTGDAGPSCSSSAAAAPGSAKSKFFEDDEESEEGEEVEEGSEEEVRGTASMFADSSTLGLCNDQGSGALVLQVQSHIQLTWYLESMFFLYIAFHNTHLHIHKAALHKMNGIPSLTSLLHFHSWSWYGKQKDNTAIQKFGVSQWYLVFYLKIFIHLFSKVAIDQKRQNNIYTAILQKFFFYKCYF